MTLAQQAAGLQWDKCITRIVNTNGHLWQFAAVTLLKPSLPHAFLLSPVLDAGSDEPEIARLLLETRRACAVQNERLATRGGPKSGRATRAFVELLDDAYFLKPLPELLLQVDSEIESFRRLIAIFVRLWDVRELREHVVFPLGFLRDERGAATSIVFPKLSNDWYIGLPEDQETHASYCCELGRIVRLLHDKARLVHFDLMPCNIAWRRTLDDNNNNNNNAVQVRLLDFDTATLIGSSLSDKLVASRVSYRKSCVWSSDRTADPRVDLWFVFQFSRIVQSRVSAPVLDENGPGRVNDAFQAALEVIQRNDEGFLSWYADWTR
jgi:hypothetical protein